LYSIFFTIVRPKEAFCWTWCQHLLSRFACRFDPISRLRFFDAILQLAQLQSWIVSLLVAVLDDSGSLPLIAGS